MSSDDEGPEFQKIEGISRWGKLVDPKKATDALMTPPGTAGEEGKAASMATPGKAVEQPSYDWLGPSLRRMYDDVLNEPIPDSFVELLKQLYDRQKRK